MTIETQDDVAALKRIGKIVSESRQLTCHGRWSW